MLGFLISGLKKKLMPGGLVLVVMWSSFPMFSTVWVAGWGKYVYVGLILVKLEKDTRHPHLVSSKQSLGQSNYKNQ